jgi:hypothetical protein
MGVRRSGEPGTQAGAIVSRTNGTNERMAAMAGASKPMQPRSGALRCGIICPFSPPHIMEAERLNAIASRLADLKGRELELRRYL